MEKDNRMTLKQAAELLQAKGYSYSLSTLKNAARDKKLKAEKIKFPLPFYLVEESDLISWANDPEAHRMGRPAKIKTE